MSARHQVSGATVEKSGSASSTGAKDAYNDTRGERRRVQRLKERRGSHVSPGHSAHMEGGRRAGVRWLRSWWPGGAAGVVCGVPRESCHEK